MPWDVEFTPEFEAWWNGLTEAEQDAIGRVVGVLEQVGPVLEYPYSSDIKGSRHGRMRELRVQCNGRPLRVLYVFDPRRVAVLLIGGDKTGNARWYEQYVLVADALYDAHLDALILEGVLKRE